MDSTTTRPTLSVDQLSSAESSLSSLFGLLSTVRYGTAQSIPSSSGIIGVPFEPLNFSRFVLGSDNLFGRTAIPKFYQALSGIRSSPAVLCYRLFFLGSELSLESCTDTLGQELLEALLASRICSDAQGTCTANLRITPVDGYFYISDFPDQRLNGQHLVYCGNDSLRLYKILKPYVCDKRYARGLDLCCGAGAQTMAIAGACDNAVGVDINPRSVAMAGLNARLNKLDHLEFVAQSIAEYRGEGFDLVVSNPPYVPMPRTAKDEYADGFGGVDGMEITKTIVECLPSVMSPQGEAVFFATSPVIKKSNRLWQYLDRWHRQESFAVEMTPLYYTLSPQFIEHQVAAGIDHVIFYLLKLKRAEVPSLKLNELDIFRRCLYSAYCKGVRSLRHGTLLRSRSHLM